MVDDKKEAKVGKKESKKTPLRKVFGLQYYIKDLTIDKIIETNIEEKKKQSYAVVFYNGTKYILEGMNNIFPKVEAELKAMKKGDEKTLTLKPEEAYGKRNKDLLKVIPYRVFKQNNLRPVVGLTIDIGEGQHGTIRSVSGGRILVDFNSPYADHDIEIYFKLVDLPENEEKIKAIIKSLLPSIKIKELSFKDKNIELKIEQGKYTEQHLKGFEQILQGILKPFVEFEKIHISF